VIARSLVRDTGITNPRLDGAGIHSPSSRRTARTTCRKRAGRD
jgi:hypothetical protein